MKAIIKILCIAVLSCITFSGVFAASIENITAIDSESIEAKLSNDIVLSTDEVQGDIKILKDIDISFASKDIIDPNKVVLTLNEDLSASTLYSLIGIFGADGNIDFATNEEVIGSEKLVSVPSGQGIIRATVVGTRSLEVLFNQPLESDEFEFKLLSEQKVLKMTSMGNNTLAISLDGKLKSDSSYIMMVLGLEDSVGTDILLEEDLYDFVTSVDLPEKIEEVEINLLTQKLQEDAEKKQQEDMEEIALNAAETPDTGAETWVLVFLTIAIQSTFIIRKKIIKA